MSNKQDATPTWSGFNYQGKVSLLIVMEHINKSILNAIHLEDICFEIEKNEDLVIYHNGTPIEMYQMKAYLHAKCSDGKRTIWSQYSEACGKLKINKEALIRKGNLLDNDDLALYLVTALEISNWAQDGNSHRDIINLYTYNNSCVGLLDVKKYIIKEIERFLELTIEMDEEIRIPVDNYYFALCNFLDERISSFHISGKDSAYKVPLKEISELFFKMSDNHDALVDAQLREVIYEALCKEWIDAGNEYCSACEECDTNCPILVHQEHSSKIELRDYLKLLNPHKRDWDSETKYLSNFDDQKFRDIILGLVHTFNRENIILLKDGLELKNPIQAFSENYKTIIPTLISLASPREDRQKASLQTTMSDISKNIDIHSRIDRHILSANIGLSEPAYHLGDESITYFPTIEGEMEERKSVSNYKIETIILDVKKIVEALKEDV